MTEPIEGACVVCARRRPYRPLACEACRSRLRSWLRELPDLVAQLGTLGYVMRDARGVRRDEVGRAWPHWDPVANAFPPGPVPGHRGEPRVSGSQERGVPERLDLTARAFRGREGTVDVFGDQVGGPSVAGVLDAWVCWLVEHRGRRERLPGQTVTELVAWLLDRLDDTCDTFDAVDDLAGELRDLWLACYRALGLTEPRPEPCLGVPCRRVDCDQKALVRVPGSPYVECLSCGHLLTEREYQEWVKMVAAAARTTRESAS